MGSSVEVVDLEGSTIDDSSLLRKHVDSALPAIPLMAAAPVLTSTSLMNDAPPSSAASSSKVDPKPVVNSKKPDMFIKFQVSDQLKKFMAKPEKEIMAQPVEPMPVESVARPFNKELASLLEEDEDLYGFMERERNGFYDRSSPGYLTPPGIGMSSLPDSLDVVPSPTTPVDEHQEGHDAGANGCEEPKGHGYAGDKALPASPKFVVGQRVRRSPEAVVAVPAEDQDKTQEAEAEDLSLLGKRITKDMSPGTKQKIMDFRENRKRSQSRNWHTKFESKGVVRKSQRLEKEETPPAAERDHAAPERSSSSKPQSAMNQARWNFVRAYTAKHNGKIEWAHRAWMKSKERAAFLAARKGEQL